MRAQEEQHSLRLHLRLRGTSNFQGDRQIQSSTFCPHSWEVLALRSGAFLDGCWVVFRVQSCFQGALGLGNWVSLRRQPRHPP